MYPSMSKAFLLIILVHLIHKCAGPRDKDCKTNKCKKYVAKCLNRVARYFKIKLETRILKTYHEDDLNFKMINGLQCAKNGIKYLNKLVPDYGCGNFVGYEYYEKFNENLDPSYIKPKSVFCGYIQPIDPNDDNNTEEAKECMEQLSAFYDDPKLSLKIGFEYPSLKYYEGKDFVEHAKSYMLHMIDNVRLYDSMDEPFVFCKQKFKYDEYDDEEDEDEYGKEDESDKEDDSDDSDESDETEESSSCYSD